MDEYVRRELIERSIKEGFLGPSRGASINEELEISELIQDKEALFEIITRNPETNIDGYFTNDLKLMIGSDETFMARIIDANPDILNPKFVYVF